jgi:S-formylglutathione hydrolase
MQPIEKHACFGGSQEVWQHQSSTLGCTMKLGIYLPGKAIAGTPCPVLYWLSGLTCSEQNFITKAGAQKYAEQHGMILVAPDTSPRGDDIPNDPAYDLGQGAGFYLNATEQPWAQHFQMDDYVAKELPQLIEQHFPASNVRSISGHSMGGHGALTIALRNPSRYCSASAFSPIVAPSQVPWGLKAFTAYLGENRQAWQQYDAVELIKAGHKPPPLLIDQGEGDEFLQAQLKPQLLQQACAQAGVPLALNLRPGFDHSYYFITSFIEEHIKFHWTHLK